ncbi:hypothetical protein C8A05DRAFT_14816, partial [Staphylotrichum tortipilum]
MDPTSQPFQQLSAASPAPFSYDYYLSNGIDGLPRVLPDASATGDSNSQVQETPTQFYTAIDNVVRTIQAKPEILDLKVEAEPKQIEEKQERGDTQQRARGTAKRKRFACDIPGCNKMFADKNNFDSHRRSHTGETPYACPHCPRRFTQGVNLKSHINRHTGARPYKCPECPKMFPQPSNVKAHLKTHVKRDLRAHWICRFGDCQKAFTAKGNLKNHQNIYHVAEIEEFNDRLASVSDKNKLSDKEKDMARYLAEVHNLANKGIKGRGKGRKVKRVHLPPQPPQQQQQQQQSFPSTSAIGTAVYAAPRPMSLLVQGFPNHHHNTAPQLSSFSDFNNPAGYRMNRPPPTAIVFGYGGPPLSLNTRDTYSYHHGTYTDQLSVYGPTSVLHVYKEEQEQE